MKYVKLKYDRVSSNSVGYHKKETLERRNER